MNRPRTVSAPEELWAKVDKAVAAGEAPTVSAFVADALQAKVGRETLREFVDAWIAETGEPSAEDYAWAEEALHGKD